jgi:polysaccharide chain length determinant protein (PEP-CTERM system associated)
MDELIRQLTSILRGMWQRRWIGLAVAWIVAALTVVGLARIPDRYEASARVYVDTQSVLKPLMSGLTVQPDVNMQISMLARTFITRPNIEKLMGVADLNITVKSEREREGLIDALTRDIRFTSSGRENLYLITYRNTDKSRAQRVVQALVSMFVESGLGNKRRDTESARKFIDDQIRSYEKKLEEAENRLKEFKLHNLAYTTGVGQDYFGRMSVQTEELAKLRLELRAAEQSRDALKRELAGEDPILLAEPSTQVGAQLPEIDARIEAMKKQLDDLLRRYTDEHPDVISARRLLTQLEEHKQAELEARRKVAPRGSAANNPVFQRIKIALAEAEAGVAALRARVAETQSRLDQLRASAGKVPQIEAELTQMNRDYDVLRKNYEALVARRESASISEDVDASAALAEFRVIDPPRVEPKAVFPNRAGLAPLALLAALCAGLGACFAYAQLFPAIHSVRDLRDVAQRPVIGSVSMRFSDVMVRKRRAASLAFAGGLAGLLVIYSSWIVWLTLLGRA